MCFVWISEQTAIISLYNINWLVFITATKCVYCAERNESFYVIQVNKVSSCNVDKLCLNSSAERVREQQATDWAVQQQATDWAVQQQATDWAVQQQTILGTVFFWTITQRVFVIHYGRFGTTYRLIIQDSWLLKMAPICCPGTSVRNHHCSPYNNPEERSSHLLHGGRQNSHKISYICWYNKYTLIQHVDGTLHNSGAAFFCRQVQTAFGTHQMRPRYCPSEV